MHISYKSENNIHRWLFTQKPGRIVLHNSENPSLDGKLYYRLNFDPVKTNEIFNNAKGWMRNIVK